MSNPTDHLHDRLDALARHGESAADPVPPDRIRAASARRTRRRAATGAAALAVVAVVSAPALSSWTGGDAIAPLPPAGSPTAPPTSTTEGIESTEGTDSSASEGVVDIETYAGRWVAPHVEGGVETFRSRDASPLDTGWRLEEAADGRVRIVAVSQVDGRDLCLTDAGLIEHVAVELCETRAQLFEVTEVGGSDVVNISSDRGLIGADPGVDRFLQPDTDPDSPATVFTLRRR